MILFLDTSSENTTVKILDYQGAIVDQKIWTSQKNQSEELLLEVDRLLAKNRLSKIDLTKIIVVCGPGSYTGLRVGLSTANALAFGLNIPIFGVKDNLSIKNLKSILDSKQSGFEQSILPKYAYPPKITRPRDRPVIA